MTLRSGLACIATVIATTSLGAPALAQARPEIWQLADRIVASPATSNTFLGGAVALDDDTLAATAFGRAHVFVRTGATWTQQAVLAPPGATSSDVSMALDGDTLLLGRPHESTALSGPPGTFHIFHRTGTTWTNELAAIGFAGDELGRAVAVHGDLACVCAGRFASIPVQLFRRSGTSWPTEAWLALNPTAHEACAVALQPDAAFVCAIRHLASGDVTDILCFEHVGASWPLQQTILDAVDARAIAVSGDTLVAGAPENDTLGANVGLAYVYERRNDVWRKEATLAPCEASAGLQFGRSVAIQGTTVVIGAQTEIAPGHSLGAVFVFTKEGEWRLRQKLTLPAGPTASGFGRSVALSDGEVAAGSAADDGPAANCGAVYLFESKPPVGSVFCFGDGTGTACPCDNEGATGRGCGNSFDADELVDEPGFTRSPAHHDRKPKSSPGARLDAYGLASVSADRVVLSCIGAPPGVSASIWQGTVPLNGGLGMQLYDGLQCIGGSLVQLTTTSSCQGHLTYPSSTEPRISVLGGVPPSGGTFHYQVRYVDRGGPCGAHVNYTNGVTLAWVP